MILNDEEKKDFMERIQGLLDIDVITSEVRREIYAVLMSACNNALCDMRKDGGQN